MNDDEIVIKLTVNNRAERVPGRPVGRPRNDGKPAGSVPRPERKPRVRKDGQPWGSGKGAVRLRVTLVDDTDTESQPDNSVPAQSNVGPSTVTVTAATSQAATAEARKLLGGPVRMINNDNGVRTYTSKEI